MFAYAKVVELGRTHRSAVAIARSPYSATVVQHGSMAKAAARLNVTQPAISDAIATLEAALGVRILNRSRKGVEPTPYGTVLLKYGQLAIDDLRQGIKEIEFLTDPTAGELRVACTETIINGLLVPVIQLLADRYPRVRLYVHQFAAPPDEIAELEQRGVDLIISRQSLGWSGGLISPALNVEELFEDHYSIVVGTQHPLAGRTRVELSDLVHERWIMTPDIAAVVGNSSRRGNFAGQAVVRQAFFDAGLQLPEFVISTYSLFLRTTLVSSGHYVSILPTSMLRLNANTLCELPVALPLPQWPVAIVTLKNRVLNPAAGLFIECVREVANSIAHRPRASKSGHANKTPAKKAI